MCSRVAMSTSAPWAGTFSSAAPRAGSELTPAHRPAAAVLIAKFQFGIGVLSIPGTFGSLGFVPGLISLFLIGAITTYGGILIGRLRERHPNIHTVSDLGYIIGGRVVREIFGIAYWILVVLTAGSGILTAAIALENISAGHGLCTLGYSGVVAAAALVFGFWAREMNKIAYAGWVGMGCVFTAIMVLTIAVLVQDRPASAPPGPVHKEVYVVNHTQFYVAISACATQVFSLLGNVTFYSIGAEMKNPRDFPKAVMAGQMFVFVSYVFVGCCVYAKLGQYIASPALGSAGLVFRKLCYSMALPGLIVSVVLYTHIGAKWVFVRALRGTPHLTNTGVVHWTAWISSYTGCLVLAWVLACAIPIFDDLLGLIGATVGSLFSIFISGLTAYYLLSDPDAERQGRVAWIKSSWRNGMSSPRKMCILGISFLIMGGGAFLIGGGVYGEAYSIKMVYQNHQAGTPFACPPPKK